jgi:Trk-type K+ transport system membrane component
MGDAAHLLLSALMIMGRLEIFAVLVLFVPLLWRRF